MSETTVAAVEEKKPKTWGYIKDCCDLVCCDWSEIAPAGNGKAQSPIDIVDAKPCGELQPISINYDNATVESIFNNGHSVQVKISPGSTITGNDSFGLPGVKFLTKTLKLISRSSPEWRI